MAKALSASRYAIGDEKFIEQVEADLREMRLTKACYGDMEWPREKPVAVEEVE